MKINTSPFARGGKGRLWTVGTLIGMSFLTLVLALGFLTGCPTATDNGDNGGGGPTLPAEYPMTLTDYAGRQVTLQAEPQKIISLAPSNTEIIYALGLEDRLMGVTTFCDYPAAALDKPKIGGFNTVELEQVVQIQPDLILAANIHIAEVVPQLESLGLTVFVVNPRGVAEIKDAILEIGRLTSSLDEAYQLVIEMENRIAAITDITSNMTAEQKPMVFYIIWHEPLMTVGPDTNIHELIGLAGGVSVAGDLGGGYPTMSLEALIAANPQVIIAGSGMGEGASLPYLFALSEERLAGVDALLYDHVYEVNTDLVGRAGPRIVDGLEAMAKLIHPEIFGLLDDV
ncbi:MAG: cobalamin-binding protein [Dehalococcoidales bacterium]